LSSVLSSRITFKAWVGSFGDANIMFSSSVRRIYEVLSK